jgi:hypothetical protein
MLIDTSDYGVYVATRNDTGEVIYVGCSWKGMKNRLYKHKLALNGNYHFNSGLQKLWNAKGLTFTHVVRCLPIKKLALAFEKAYGAQYDFKKLMNVNPLGKEVPDCTGKKQSKKTKEKMSKSMTKNWKDNPERKLEYSERMTGDNHYLNKKTPEEREERCKGISERTSGENNWVRKLTPEEYDEECKKRSKLYKGENNPNVKINIVIARTIKFLLFYTTLTHQEIADGIPGVTVNIVRKISAGTAWKDVELAPCNKRIECPEISGRMKGENNPLAKLTEKRVRMLKVMFRSDIKTVKQLSKLFGVSETTIRRVKNGDSWSHVKVRGWDC